MTTDDRLLTDLHRLMYDASGDITAPDPPR